MSNAISLESAQALQVANSLAQASSRILDFRVDNFDSLSAADVARLEKLEDELDHLVVLLRSRGVELIGEDAAEASQEIAGAIEDGKQVLANIKEVRNAMRAAVALTELAVALLGRDARGALSSIKELRSVAQDSDGISKLLGQV